MNTEYIIIGINLVLFVIAPFLPNIVYKNFVETYVGIIILLVAALYSISFGYLAAVSSFIGIASLYSESHSRAARSVKSVNKATGNNQFENQIQPSPELIPHEVHPDIESPSDEVVKNVPEEETGNSFRPVDTSIDNKTNLPTISDTKEAEDIYLKDNLASTELKD